MTNSHRERLKAALERELDQGEEFLWIGFPAKSIFMRRAYSTIKVSFIIAIILTCFTVAIHLIDANSMYMQALAKNPKLDKTYGDYLPTKLGWLLTFWAIPLSFVSFAAIPHFKRQANEIAYGITQNRALILRQSKSGKLRERDYRPDELIHLSRNEDANGIGDVVFQSARGANATNQTSTRHGFLAVEDAVEVERLLRKQFGDA